jgi:hypothetical protein
MTHAAGRFRAGEGLAPLREFVELIGQLWMAAAPPAVRPSSARCGEPIRSASPLDWGIRPVMEPATDAAGLPDLPPYVPRDHDRALREAIDAVRLGESRMVVATGEWGSGRPLSRVNRRRRCDARTDRQASVYGGRCRGSPRPRPCSAHSWHPARPVGQHAGSLRRRPARRVPHCSSGESCRCRCGHAERDVRR